MDGWLKLYRQIENNVLWSDKPFSRGQAWLDLLIMANYADGEVISRGVVVEVKKGQVFRTQKFLADRWGWSPKKTRNFINLLKNLKMATAEGIGQGTLITIENYSVYQDEGQAEGQAEGKTEGEQRADKGTQKKKKKKNNNNINNIICAGEFKNVALSEEELEKLKERFPYDWQDRIERLSSYMESKGKRYKSHYATILSWARKEERDADAERGAGAKGEESTDRERYRADGSGFRY